MRRRGTEPGPLILCLYNNFLFVGKCCLKKYKVWGRKSPILPEFKNKIEILAPMIFSVGNLQLSVGKM